MFQCAGRRKAPAACDNLIAFTIGTHEKWLQNAALLDTRHKVFEVSFLHAMPDIGGGDFKFCEWDM